MLFFRLGQKDAQILDPVVHSRFSSEDMAHIPDWQGHAKAQLTSSNVQPFRLATEKDVRAFYPSRAKQHRNQTQKHYGMHYQDVDEQIARRRDIIFEPVD